MTERLAQIERCAYWILSLTLAERALLARLLSDGGDPTGVAAVLPTIPPERESGAEAELPPDYWETAQ